MDVKAERGCAARDWIRLCGGLVVGQSERHDRKPRSRRQPGCSRRRPDEAPAGKDFGVKALVMLRRLSLQKPFPWWNGNSFHCLPPLFASFNEGRRLFSTENL